LKAKINTDLLLLGFILALGTVLRFYDYFGLPYSYDEFSALFRTRFDAFTDVINLGVVQTDTHPAGVQVFMYFWVQVFGESEPIVKLPFMLAGIGAIFLGYKIGTAWFGPANGLITAMFLAFLQYPITFAQYARPYASGLFLVLLFVWFLHKAFIQPDRRWRWYVLGYVFAGAACAYNHHFTLFFVGLAGISSFFLVPVKRWKKLFFANLAILILYLPHIWIFFAQLQKGGIESWLKKPDWGFFLDYGSYLLHHSNWMIGITVLLFGLSLTGLPKAIRSGNQYRIVLLLWILVTYLTAYYYSIYRNAVLQHSVLLFTFPFLVMVVFSFVGELNRTVKTIMVLVFAGISTLTLIYERQHYDLQYQSVLEQTFAETDKAREQFGTSEVTCLTNISPKIQHFYSETYDLDPGSIITFDTATKGYELRQRLENLETDYLNLGWVNVRDLEILAIAREVYPILLKKRMFKSGDVFLLSKSDSIPDSLQINDRLKTIRIDSLLLYRNAVTSGYPMLFLNNRLMMPGWLGYTRFYEAPLHEFLEAKEGYVFFSVEVENPKPDFTCQMICEMYRADSLIYWTAKPFSDFTRSEWGRYKVHICLKLRDLDLDLASDRIHLYLANLDEAYFYINHVKVEVLEGNPYLYTMLEKIPD
jgi:hypothetical protein